jgi:hypothetical protein
VESANIITLQENQIKINEKFGIKKPASREAEADP